jgi:tRNA (guanine-N7-)-methyltransferase
MHITKYDHAARLPDGDHVDLTTLIAGRGPLLLEIGSGRGMFALQWAAQHPDARLIALEIRRKLAALLDARLPTNARCFAEDAGAALQRCRPDGCVTHVVVHFPDPWWKKRHQKRLVVRDTFVSELARLVAPGGTVFVQTDVENRAHEYLERFTACEDFEVLPSRADPWSPESPHAPARSNREARAILDGLPVWRLVFRRRTP